MQNKDMFIQEYLEFTFEDLEVEHITQTEKANNPKLSPVMRMNALERIQVIDLSLEVYMAAAEAGLDVTRMTLSTALYEVTGKDPSKGGYGVLSRANQGLDRAVDVSVEAIRLGANKLGQWLTRVSTKQ
jgi:hypothetical protein